MSEIVQKLGGGTSLKKLGTLTGDANSQTLPRITDALLFLVVIYDADDPSTKCTVVVPNLPETGIKVFRGGNGVRYGTDWDVEVMIDYGGINRTIGLWDMYKNNVQIANDKRKADVYYI